MSAFCATAQGAISLQLAPNFDATRTTAYPNGDKPDVTCVPPSTWTEVDIGDGFGEVCDTTGEWVFSVGGTTFRQNAHLIYKDAGAADVQFEGTVEDDYSEVTGSNAGLGIGLRETALVDSFIFQLHVENTGANIVKCTYGADGSYTTIDGAAGLSRPLDLGVTYDVSSGDLKAFRGGLEVCTTNRAMSDVLAYAVGQSKSITETLTATLTAPTLASTIDLYTPSDPPGGSPPVLTSAIPNQTGTQGDAFSLTFSAYFTGATSYSTTAFPASSGLSETSDGVVSGTVAAADVTASPYSEDLCATNASGTTCDTVQFAFSAPPASGDVFTIPDVGDTASSTYNCATTGGANGSSWASIRSSGSGTTPGPGDTIRITSGTRGPTEFRNCHGSASNPIFYQKTASETQLVITNSSQSGDTFLFRDSTYGELDGTVNWTGHTGGCGVEIDATGLVETPLTDCGIKLDHNSQFGLKWRGQAFGWTVRGIEADGNWTGSGNSNGEVAISPNDQNYCVSDTPSLLNREFRENFLIEQNHFHDYAEEIFYFGSNYSYGNCPVDQVPRLRDITIRHNFIQNAGWDGLNLKSAFTGTNIIEYNVVMDIGGGVVASGANSVCIALFESQGIVRYNKCRRMTDPPGGANGIHQIINKAPASWGLMEFEAYGNDVSDADGNCIHAGDTAAATQSVEIYNNTLTDCGAQPVNIAAGTTTGVVRDNIANKAFNATNNTTATNNRNCAEASCGFVDHVNDDYRITSGSPARNSGTNNCPSTDIVGTSRPQGSACDQGAYEFDE